MPFHAGDTESNPRPREQAVTVDDRSPFVLEASGSETHFTNGYDPQPRARKPLAFPQPAALARMVRDAAVDPQAPTLSLTVTASSLDGDPAFRSLSPLPR
jgi:hypothetical protein